MKKLLLKQLLLPTKNFIMDVRRQIEELKNGGDENDEL